MFSSERPLTLQAYLGAHFKNVDALPKAINEILSKKLESELGLNDQRLEGVVLPTRVIQVIVSGKLVVNVHN